MSRNRNQATEVLFLLVKDHFDPSETTGADFNKARWVQGDSDDIDWLTNAKIIGIYRFSSEKQFCHLEFRGRPYFVATGFEVPSSIPVGLESVELNAGLFVAAVSELELPILKTVSKESLEENILSQHKDSDQYTGHDFRDLVPIFPVLFVAEITSEFFGDVDDLLKLAAYYVASNRNLLELPFAESTLDEVIYLLATNSNILNCENILQALLASQFKFAFLDLYRCLELLYQVVYIDETSLALGMSNQQFKVLSAIDETLGWRPVESTALERIFSGTPPTAMDTLGEAIRAFDGNVLNYSKWVYMLRNSIVHLKPTHKSVELKIAHWEPILRGMVRVLKHWYQRYYRFQ